MKTDTVFPSAANTRRRFSFNSLLSFISLSLAALLLCGGLVGCSQIQPIKGTKEELTPVGTVSDDAGVSYDVLYEEFRYVTLLYKKSIAKTYGYDNTSIWQDAAFAAEHEQELQTAVYANLRNNYAILQLCSFFEIDTDSDELNEQVQKDIEETVNAACNGSMSEYKTWLAENNLTDHYLRFLFANSFLESAVYYALADNRIYMEYNTQNLSAYKQYVLESGDYCRTLAIYLACDTVAEKAEKKETALEIARDLQSIVDQSDRFDRFKEYFGSSVNDDLQMTTTKGYYFTRGEMNEAYEQAAFALENYGISDPVETDSGYYVILRLPLEELYVEKNIETLLKNYQAVVLEKVENAYREALTFTPNDVGKQYKLSDMQ